MSLVEILLGVLCGLLVNEFCDLSPWLARRIVRWATGVRYRDDPERAAIRREELENVTNQPPGKLFKLLVALPFAVAAVSYRVKTRSRGIRNAGATRTSVKRQASVLGIALLLTVAVVANSTSMISASRFLGLGYFLTRAALLFAGIVLMNRPGRQSPIGLGMLTAGTVWSLTDAAVSIHNSSNVGTWLELLAAITLIGLLPIRVPLRSIVPRQVRIALPTRRRPLAYLTLTAAAIQLLLLLFVSFPTFYGSVTVIDVAGAGGLLAVVPLAGLCAAIAMAKSVPGKPQRIFVTTVILTYCGPELYLMLGSLAFGPQFTYLGNGLWGTELSIGWFVLVQATVTAALATSALLLLHPEEPTITREVDPSIP